MSKIGILTVISALCLLFAVTNWHVSADGTHQLVILGIDESAGNIGFFEWSGAEGLVSVGAARDSSVAYASYGMTVADLDGDGFDEALLVRGTTTTNQCVEIWKYNGTTASFGQIWTGACTNTKLGSVGGVGDFDGDGRPEFIRTTGTAQQIWGDDDGNLKWTLEADVTPVGCGGTNPVRFVRAGGDMDGDGIPEFLSSCATGGNSRSSSVVQVREWDGSRYSVRASWTIPSSTYYMDDSDCRGDIDGDGHPECVFSGNDDKMSHVVSFKGGSWQMIFNSPVAPSYVASCKMGDFDGDGRMEYYDYAETSAAGGTRKNPIPANQNVTLRFFKFNTNTGRIEWWQSLSNLNAMAHIVSSTMSGDIDDDGRDEVGLVTGWSAPYSYSFMRYDTATHLWNIADVISPVAVLNTTARVGRLR